MTISARLKSDIQEILNKTPEGFTVKFDEKDYLSCEAIIPGPDKSPWEGGKFEIVITFPANYPDNPPTVEFPCEMFHPNIKPANGKVCVNFLDPDEWKTEYNIYTVLTHIQMLLKNPNPLEPANIEAAELFVKNRDEYNKKAEKITENSKKKFAEETG